MQNKEARADEVMCDCKNVRKHGKYRNDTWYDCWNRSWFDFGDMHAEVFENRRF